jgi:uncharacterized membrane protein
MSEHEPIDHLQEERTVYQFFLWSVILKGVISVAEIAAGIALFFIPPHLIVAGGNLLLSVFPSGTITDSVEAEIAKYTAGTVTFVAFYLISRGLIKAVLVAALLKNKLWAYPSSLLVLAAFVVYQCYQIAQSHSAIIIAVTLFDLVVMYFIWREWRIVARHSKEKTA